MLILHIGLPKTGTTFLQYRVFAPTPGLAFVHRRRGPEEAQICRELLRFSRAGPIPYRLHRPGLVRRLQRFADTTALPVLVSDENLSSLSAGFWLGQGTSPARLARRLAALGPRLGPRLRPIRVVIGIRRQDQWLASRYAESSKHFPGFGQADFDRRMAAIAAGPGLPGPLGWLDHHAVRETFVAALGRDGVFILPQEHLAEDEATVLRALVDFLDGLPLNRADRRGGRSPTRRNELAQGENRWQLKRDGTILHLTPELQAALAARFAASNAALAAAMPRGFGS